MKKIYTQKATNSVEPAATTSRDWGFKKCKFGETTNFEIPSWMFDEEMKLLAKEGS